MQTLIALLVTLIAGVGGNILIKAGMKDLPQAGIGISFIIKILSTPAVLAGIFLLTASFPFYSMVIQRLGLGVGLPLIMSFNIIGGTIASFLLFKESLSTVNVMGIFLIVGGIWLLSQK